MNLSHKHFSSDSSSFPNYVDFILTTVAYLFFQGFAGLAVYSGTKFFVEGFSQGMRCELAKEGIRVTTIQPGDVKTELPALTTDEEVIIQFISLCSKYPV